jgi:hypothetical protein
VWSARSTADPVRSPDAIGARPTTRPPVAPLAGARSQAIAGQILR